MQLEFTKMHGLGNDFIVIDATQTEVNLTSEQIRNLGDRHFGIGFDTVWKCASATHDADTDACAKVLHPPLAFHTKVSIEENMEATAECHGMSTCRPTHAHLGRKAQSVLW